jgi:hypothetical protein
MRVLADSGSQESQPEDLAKRIEDARKQFPGALKELEKDANCKVPDFYVAFAEGKEDPRKLADRAPPGFASNKEEFVEGWKNITAEKRADMLPQVKALSAFCKAKTEESFLDIIKLEHVKDMHTCLVSANTFKQTFRKVDDYSGSTAWVVDAQPSGSCGVVQLDRFEPEISSGITFWRYIARKAVTNPKGTLAIPNMTCSDLDQGEYLYDWRIGDDRKLNCTFIRFSPI